MQKYFYIGVRYEHVVVSATGATRKRQTVRWNNVVYPTAIAAAEACAQMMAQHLGMSFFVQGFERKLLIEDGESKGFLAEETGA